MESTRRRGQRERAAAEVAALREQLHTANRRLVELDIRRENLERLAGPAAARAGAVQQWQTIAQTLPQVLESARTSDLQDAALAAASARGLQQRADEQRALVGALTNEQRIRAGLPPETALSEAVDRATARLTAPRPATVDAERDAAYDYDQTAELDRDRDADEERGRGR